MSGRVGRRRGRRRVVQFCCVNGGVCGHWLSPAAPVCGVGLECVRLVLTAEKELEDRIVQQEVGDAKLVHALRQQPLGQQHPLGEHVLPEFWGDGDQKQKNEVQGHGGDQQERKPQVAVERVDLEKIFDELIPGGAESLGDLAVPHDGEYAVPRLVVGAWFGSGATPPQLLK
eukprot:614421-Prymnesium_polylepis.1